MFIEITERGKDKSYFININEIRYVTVISDGSASIFFENNNAIICLESYNDVVEMIKKDGYK